MKLLTHKIQQFLKTETVLFISASAAILSMILIPPSADYFEYIDFRVLSLLFCLMAVVAGFQKTGVFLVLSEKMLKKVANTRSLSFVLIMLCFFSSMWITNDVALITFVPFAILVLSITGQTQLILIVVILQTIAANLGSMLTPVGNPQNLYLYSKYNIPVIDFLRITLPITAVSFLLLCITVFVIKKEHLSFLLSHNEKTDKHKPYTIALYSGLFLVCLACVLRLIDYRFTLLLIVFATLIFDREVLKKVDYSLLLTFVSFFVFVGNIGNITAVKDFLGSLLEGKELLVSILASQIISNVPAAVLLSAFTKDYKALLLGTDIGGLGTLVASLASLISYKFYCRTEGAKPGKYLGVFTLFNVIFLLLLCVFYWLTTLVN
jgi:Na+/H+ antiporter NhaD/arsenite permease-like protein